jgi:glucose-1-phosphate adenylyltransferase
MKERECIAMVLANGRGAKLGALTSDSGKSAMIYGGSHRIIDFALNNCRDSGIDVVGVLPQYLNGGLDSYIGDGRMWNLSGQDGGIFMLPFPKNEKNYLCAVDAVYRNIGFIEQFSPEYVCILSGDHIYKMDYAEMLDAHKRNNADATVAVILVPFLGIHRYGVVDIDENGKIFDFAEKPLNLKINFAPMGVYIFNWDILKKYLTAGDSHGRLLKDFGKDVLPTMLSAGERLYAYRFEGYWRDAETVENLWESNMDLLSVPPKFVLDEKDKEMFPSLATGTVNRSILCGLHVILGRVEHSVLSDSVVVEEGAEVIDSVLMPNVYVGKNTKVHRAIVGPNVKIMNDVEIGVKKGVNYSIDWICTNGVSLIAPGTYIAEKTKIYKNSYIENRLFANNFDFHTVCLDRQHLPVFFSTA